MSVLSYPAMPSEATLPKDFTARQRILIGGLGALTPIVLNALIVDLPKIFQAMSVAVLVGWSLRVLVLFYLGGLFSWLHKKEREPVRIFELGILAPALITAMINGTNTEMHNAADEELRSGAARSSAGSATTTVGLTQQEPVYSFDQPPQESIADALLRGFMGRRGHGDWFVYENQSFSTTADAHARARELRQYGIPARVYQSGGPVSGYVVVLGDWLTDHAAAHLQTELSRRNVQSLVWERPARKSGELRNERSARL